MSLTSVNKTAEGLRSLPSVWCDRICLALIAIGSAIRVHQWALNRSFWLDEAMLAVNVVDRDLSGLAEPLKYSQSAPYLFLAGSDLLTLLWGYDERVLRSLPLVASLVTLVLFWRLVRGCVGTVPAIAGVATLALGYPSIYYAQEFKHYAVEGMVMVLMLTATVWVVHAPERFLGRFPWFWLAGAAGLWASFTAPFVLAGTGAAVAHHQLRLGRGRAVWIMLSVGAIGWMTMFAAIFHLFIKVNLGDPFMRDYWAFAYPGAPWTLPGLQAWAGLTNKYLSFLGYNGAFKVVISLLFLIGVVAVVRRRDTASLAALVAVGCYGLAIGSGHAPFHGRVSYFVFPALLLLVCRGLDEMTGWRPVVLAPLAALGLMLPLLVGAPRLVTPIEVHTPRDGVRALLNLVDDDTPVYVTPFAQAALHYYLAGESTPSLNLVLASRRFVVEQGAAGKYAPPVIRQDPAACAAEMGQLRDHRRFWVLTTHADQREADLFAEIAKTMGFSATWMFKDKGIGVVLFERG